MSVLAISTPVTGTRKKAVETARTIETAKAGKYDKENKREYLNFTQVPCIQYPITFRKKSVPVSVLFDSSGKINAIHPTFT